MSIKASYTEGRTLTKLIAISFKFNLVHGLSGPKNLEELSKRLDLEMEEIENLLKKEFVPRWFANALAYVLPIDSYDLWLASSIK